MRKVLLLGASGSIGSQTLDILKKHGSKFELVGFSVGLRVEKIETILKDFPTVRFICVRKEIEKEKLKRAYPYIRFFHGDDGLSDIIVHSGCDMVVNALVGFAGLVPSIASLRLNKTLCLANKESLVVGGALICELLDRGSGSLIPIDSEHVAIDKLLSRLPRKDIDKLLITASGGAFRDLPREELIGVTPERALAHPTWDMGAKITIDSATMMNKGFEVLEAKWLFDFPLEKTEILMHRESMVHSAVLMKDGTYWVDISKPDMHVPIEYALLERKIDFSLMHVNSLSELRECHFGTFDPNRYPCVNLALSSFRRGGSACAVLNGANEESVYAFLNRKIGFLEIEDIISSALESVPFTPNPSLDDLIRVDTLTREYVRSEVIRRHPE